MYKADRRLQHIPLYRHWHTMPTGSIVKFLVCFLMFNISFHISQDATNISRLRNLICPQSLLPLNYTSQYFFKHKCIGFKLQWRIWPDRHLFDDEIHYWYQIIFHTYRNSRLPHYYWLPWEAWKKEQKEPIPGVAPRELVCLTIVADK